METAKDMSLMEHLSELRYRLLIIFITVGLGAIVTYSYSGAIFDFLNFPYFTAFPKSSLIGTGPAEAFMLKVKVAVFASLLLTSPVISYQIWAFVQPGLYPEEKRLMIPFLGITTFLFFGGVYLAYYYILPLSFHFFKEQYDSIAVTPQIKVSESLNVTLQLLLAFGITFQLPVLTFFLARSGLVTAEILISGARYAILGIVILAAILTPPDVLSQILMAAPLILLYGISILVARYAAPVKDN